MFRFKHRLITLAVFCSLFSGMLSAVRADEQAEPTPPPVDKWAKHYHDRVALFRAENVEPGGIVLVGSSHVEGFDTGKLLPGRRIVNRGIISDRIGLTDRGILHRLDCSVFDCKPSIIFLENGVNDLGELWRHGTPSIEEVETCYREVVKRIRNRLPEAPLVIVGLFPTRDNYAELNPMIVDLNRRLTRIAEDFHCPFMDVHASYLDADGALKAEYSRDGLHLNEAGYRVWAAQIENALAATAPIPGRLDPARATSQPSSDLLWYDAKELTIEGKGWADTEAFYRRLPARAKDVVPDAVWSLSKHTAGIAVRFVTNSPRIAATWDGGGAMNHMAATGNSGLDLYARRDGQWVFCGVGRPNTEKTTADVAKGLGTERTEYMLYLPLYNGTAELQIGIEPGATLATAPPRPAEQARPIVFYGTSITQGGCASRTGMCHAAILGRWLNREVINLGFSGAGKMEPALVDLLSELDPAVYVLEALPNMTTELVRERIQPSVRRLRQARPDTPILLVESPLHPDTNPGNPALREAFNALKQDGVKNLYYLEGKDQLAGPENGTVDGVHPTDLGFYRMAVAYRPMLERILSTGANPDHE
jgi:lysophospholipase L1-like esterase